MGISSYSLLYSVSMYFIIYLLITIPSIKIISMFMSSNTIDLVSGRRVHIVIENLPSLFHLISPSNALFVFMLFIMFDQKPAEGPG